MKEKREKKHSLLARMLAFVGVLLLVGGGIAWFLIGLHATVVLALLAGVGSISGPAMVEGGSILEGVASIIEGIIEGLATVLEAIGSLFNF